VSAPTPTTIKQHRPIQSRTARENVMRLALELAEVTRKTVDAVEGRGAIAYESEEYDKLIDQSVDIQCDILSWVEWDRATPEERKAKNEAAKAKESAA
jgi:hypothetical protein